MNEQDIVKIFQVKKVLTVEEFARIKDLTLKSAKQALKAMYNKGRLERITNVKDDEEKIYYFLAENKQEASKMIRDQDKQRSNHKNKQKNSRGSSPFYSSLGSMLGNKIKVKLFNGDELIGTFKNYEPNHLSIFLETDDELMMIRGNAIHSLSLTKGD